MSDRPGFFKRVFVAIPLPETVRRALATVRRELETVGAHVGWVEPLDYHLTLAFLGDLESDCTEALAQGLDEALVDFEAFSFGVVGLGFFGPRGRPRVLWAGVEGPLDALTALHGRVRQVLQSLGLPLEERPFSPHITLGRVRDAIRVGALTGRVESLKSARYGVVGADCIHVMARAEHSQRSRYQSLHETLLKGAVHGCQNRCE